MDPLHFAAPSIRDPMKNPDQDFMRQKKGEAFASPKSAATRYHGAFGTSPLASFLPFVPVFCVIVGASLVVW